MREKVKSKCEMMAKNCTLASTEGAKQYINLAYDVGHISLNEKYELIKKIDRKLPEV